jgi:hypothetical protein
VDGEIALIRKALQDIAYELGVLNDLLQDLDERTSRTEPLREKEVGTQGE